MFLRASPVDVSELLRGKLFEKVETCVLTSATLSSAGSFNFVRERLGLDTSKTNVLHASSSFDYENQAIVYLPKSMPDPRTPEFTQLAAGEIVVVAAHGLDFAALMSRLHPSATRHPTALRRRRFIPRPLV